MSNSAAPTPPSGPNSTTPNASAPVPVRRRKPTASAFVEKKKPTARKPGTTQRPAQATANKAQPSTGQPSAQAQAPATAAPGQAPAEPNFVEYGVYISKKDIEEGMRYHGFKFTTRHGPDNKAPVVDPYDASQFTRPVRLHRRYARDKQETGQPSDAPPGIDDKERELYNARRAERQAEREANQALIAPTGTANKKAQGKKKNQKVVEDVYYNENNPKQQKAAQLRYEETKPWHLEDFENKNTWIGTYQEPMSSSSVLLTVDKDHAIFTMTPIERWYKFTQTNRLDTMTAEEADKYMSAGVKPDRWFMKTQAGQEEERQNQAKIKREQVAARKRAEAAEDNDGYVAVKDEGEFYNADRDDLDFEFNDEFQDDDEGAMFGNLEEDEAKDIERRIREEMRGANISAPGLKNTEMDYDEEEMRLKLEERAQKKREKRMKKQLIRKERKMEYEDDSEENPYSESSEDEDSDEERERLEQERKEEEERKAGVANGDKSGASTKGTNTPSGRAEKKDPSRSNASLAASLKRPGSPNLSDASGTESRKRPKTTLNGRSGSRKF